jgi:hypothetical protein
MKKNFSVFSVLLVLLMQIMVSAQVADTVLVPTEDSQGQPGTLARFILGDTTATGERNNINRVYKLQRGGIYLLQGQMYCEKFPLILIADDDETTAPPVIAPFPLADGSIPRITITVYKNSLFKNIYMQGCAPNDVRNSSDRPFATAAVDSITITVENCIIEGFKTAGLYNASNHAKIFMKDNLWRNNNWKGVFTGQFFYNAATATIDTLSIVNNTFFCGSSYFMCTNRKYAGYVRFEHNTLFINHTNPFYAPYLSNADIKNNIFFSPAAGGETEAERIGGYYDWNGERLAVFSIDTIPTDIATENGITDENRRVVFSNNAYYWPQVLKDFWAANDTVDAPLFMNDRTKNFFSNDSRYPNLVEENNTEVDPGFNSSIMTMVDTLMTYVNLFRKQGSAIPYFYNPQGGSIFPCRWPIPEDLAYSNVDLQSAGTDGFALGDLNWFPEQKAEWLITGVEIENPGYIPVDFTISDAYPNPFNPETNIKFNLAKAAKVKLAVYNVLGEKVKDIINSELNAGSYSAKWDATDNSGVKVASGIYMFRIESESFTAAKKIVLMK